MWCGVVWCGVVWSGWSEAPRDEERQALGAFPRHSARAVAVAVAVARAVGAAGGSRGRAVARSIAITAAGAIFTVAGAGTGAVGGRLAHSCCCCCCGLLAHPTGAADLAVHQLADVEVAVQVAVAGRAAVALAGPASPGPAGAAGGVVLAEDLGRTLHAAPVIIIRARAAAAVVFVTFLLADRAEARALSAPRLPWPRPQWLRLHRRGVARLGALVRPAHELPALQLQVQ